MPQKHAENKIANWSRESERRCSAAHRITRSAAKHPANIRLREPTLGEFREGMLMTRYFSQVILEDDGGTLTEVEQAVREET